MYDDYCLRMTAYYRMETITYYLIRLPAEDCQLPTGLWNSR